MESGSENLQPRENITELNPELKSLLNNGLNIAIGEFVRSNKIDGDEPEDIGYETFMDNLDILCDSVDQPNGFIVREQRLDRLHDKYYIKLDPKDRVDMSKTNKYGGYTLDLSAGQVNECQITIKPYSDFVDNAPEPEKVISHVGYEIDFSVSSIQTGTEDDNKVSFSNKKAGIGIKVALNGMAQAYVKTYLSRADFAYDSPHKRFATGDSKQSSVNFLSKLGLSNPVEKI